MALSPKEMHARIIENLKTKTGKDFAAWANITAKIQGDKSDKDLIAELKSDHGLGHYTAFAIVKEMRNGNAYADEQALVDKLFAMFPRARASFENLSAWLLEKPEVGQTPCKTYVGFRTKRQFAIARPTKRDSLEIGLTLPVSASNSLSPAKNFGGSRIMSKVEVEAQTLSVEIKSMVEQSFKTNH
ncbi:MAG: DUF4287 domain-containing protein [Pseudomonadota bacterium]